MTAIEELDAISGVRLMFASGMARELRVRARLGIRELAERAGVDPTALWRWEHGKRVPRSAAAMRLAPLYAALAAVEA